jgi:hypothetical protein
MHRIIKVQNRLGFVVPMHHYKPAYLYKGVVLAKILKEYVCIYIYIYRERERERGTHVVLVPSKDIDNHIHKTMK